MLPTVSQFPAAVLRELSRISPQRAPPLPPRAITTPTEMSRIQPIIAHSLVRAIAAVESVEASNGAAQVAITATVLSTDTITPYNAAVTYTDSEWRRPQCSCPTVNRDKFCCKHVAAVIMTVYDGWNKIRPNSLRIEHSPSLSLSSTALTPPQPTAAPTTTSTTSIASNTPPSLIHFASASVPSQPPAPAHTASAAIPYPPAGANTWRCGWCQCDNTLDVIICRICHARHPNPAELTQLAAHRAPQSDINELSREERTAEAPRDNVDEVPAQVNAVNDEVKSDLVAADEPVIDASAVAILPIRWTRGTTSSAQFSRQHAQSNQLFHAPDDDSNIRPAHQPADNADEHSDLRSRPLPSFLQSIEPRRSRKRRLVAPSTMKMTRPSGKRKRTQNKSAQGEAALVRQAAADVKEAEENFDQQMDIAQTLSAQANPRTNRRARQRSLDEYAHEERERADRTDGAGAEPVDGAVEAEAETDAAARRTQRNPRAKKEAKPKMKTASRVRRVKHESNGISAEAAAALREFDVDISSFIVDDDNDPAPTTTEQNGDADNEYEAELALLRNERRQKAEEEAEREREEQERAKRIDDESRRLLAQFEAVRADVAEQLQNTNNTPQTDIEHVVVSVKAERTLGAAREKTESNRPTNRRKSDRLISADAIRRAEAEELDAAFDILFDVRALPHSPQNQANTESDHANTQDSLVRGDVDDDIKDTAPTAQEQTESSANIGSSPLSAAVDRSNPLRSAAPLRPPAVVTTNTMSWRSKGVKLSQASEVSQLKNRPIHASVQADHDEIDTMEPQLTSPAANSPKARASAKSGRSNARSRESNAFDPQINDILFALPSGANKKFADAVDEHGDERMRSDRPDREQFDQADFHDVLAEAPVSSRQRPSAVSKILSSGKSNIKPGKKRLTVKQKALLAAKEEAAAAEAAAREEARRQLREQFERNEWNESEFRIKQRERKKKTQEAIQEKLRQQNQQTAADDENNHDSLSSHWTRSKREAARHRPADTGSEESNVSSDHQFVAPPSVFPRNNDDNNDEDHEETRHAEPNPALSTADHPQQSVAASHIRHSHRRRQEN